MPIDKIDSLYANLEAISKNKGIPLVDKETFIKNMQIPEKVKKLRTDLSNMGYQVVDENTFIENMKIEEQKTQEVKTVEQTKPYTEEELKMARGEVFVPNATVVGTDPLDPMTPTRGKQQMIELSKKVAQKPVDKTDMYAVTKKELTTDEIDIQNRVKQKTPKYYEQYKQMMQSSEGSVKTNLKGYQEIIEQLYTGLENITRNITGEEMLDVQKEQLADRIADWNGRAAAFAELYKEGNVGEKISGALSQFAPMVVQLIATRSLGRYGLTVGALSSGLTTASRDVDIDLADALNIAANAGAGYLQMKFTPSIKVTDTIPKIAGKFTVDTFVDQSANIILNQIYNLKEIPDEEKRNAFDGWLQTFAMNSIANGISIAEIKDAFKRSSAVKKFAEKEQLKEKEKNELIDGALYKAQKDVIDKKKLDRKIDILKQQEEGRLTEEQTANETAYSKDNADSDIEQSVNRALKEEVDYKNTEQNVLKILSKTIRDVKKKITPTLTMKSLDKIISGEYKNVDEFANDVMKDIDDVSKVLISEGDLDAGEYNDVGRKQIETILNDLKLEVKNGNVPLDKLKSIANYVSALDTIRRNKGIVYVKDSSGNTVASNANEVAQKIADTQIESDKNIPDSFKILRYPILLPIQRAINSVQSLETYIQRFDNPLLKKFVVDDAIDGVEKKSDIEQYVVKNILPKSKIAQDIYEKRFADDYYDVGLPKKLSTEELLSIYLTKDTENGYDYLTQKQNSIERNTGMLDVKIDDNVLSKITKIVEGNKELSDVVSSWRELSSYMGKIQQPKHMQDTGQPLSTDDFYFPLNTDRRSVRGSKEELFGINSDGRPEILNKFSKMVFDTTLRQKTRVKHDLPLIIKPFGEVMRGYVRDVSDYVGMKTYVDNLYKVLQQPVEVNGKKIRLDAYLADNYGKDTISKIKTAVRDEIQGANTKSKLLRIAQGALSQATFFANASSSIKSAFSAETYLANQDKSIRDAAMKLLSDVGYENIKKQALESNSLLFDRYYNLTYNISLNTLKGYLSLFEKTNSPALKAYRNFIEKETTVGQMPMQESDKFVMSVIYASELAKLQSVGYDIQSKDTQKIAGKNTAVAMLKTQPSVNNFTSAPITLTDLGKIGLMYRSQNMQNLNIVTEGVIKSKQAEVKLYEQAQKTILYENLIKQAPELRTSQEGYKRELEKLNNLKEEYYDSVKKERRIEMSVFIIQPLIMGLINTIKEYFFKEKRTEKLTDLEKKKTEALIKYYLKDLKNPSKETKAAIESMFGVDYKTFQEEYLTGFEEELFQSIPILGDIAFNMVRSRLPGQESTKQYNASVDAPLFNWVNRATNFFTGKINASVEEQRKKDEEELERLRIGLQGKDSTAINKLIQKYINDKNKSEREKIKVIKDRANLINNASPAVTLFTGIGIPVSPLTIRLRREEELRERQLKQDLKRLRIGSEFIK